MSPLGTQQHLCFSWSSLVFLDWSWIGLDWSHLDFGFPGEGVRLEHGIGWCLGGGGGSEGYWNWEFWFGLVSSAVKLGDDNTVEYGYCGD